MLKHGHQLLFRLVNRLLDQTNLSLDILQMCKSSSILLLDLLESLQERELILINDLLRGILLIKELLLILNCHMMLLVSSPLILLLVELPFNDIDCLFSDIALFS